MKVLLENWRLYESQVLTERLFLEEIDLFTEELSQLEEAKVLDAFKDRSKKLFAKYSQAKKAAIEPLLKKGIKQLRKLAATKMPTEWSECAKLGFSGKYSCRKRLMKFIERLERPENLAVGVAHVSLLISALVGNYFEAVATLLGAFGVSGSIIQAYEVVSGIKDFKEISSQVKKVSLGDEEENT